MYKYSELYLSGLKCQSDKDARVPENNINGWQKSEPHYFERR